MKRKLLLITLLLTLMLVWGGVTSAQDTVTVHYWHTHSDAETANLDELISTFEQANPGITIDATRYAYDDFKQALLTGIAGGEAPDVARLDIVWVPEFADLGALQTMDDIYPDFNTVKDGFFPGPLTTTHWNGHYWGLPLDTNTQVLLYNKAEFDAAGLQPPTTVAEFADDACKLTKGTDQYGYAMGGTYFWAIAPLFYAQGGKITDDAVTTADGYVNSDASVAAFQTVVDLYNKGCLSPNLLGGGVATDAGHATGLYSMIIDGPWMVDIYKGSYPDFKVNFAPIPNGPDGTTSSVVGGEDVVMFAGTPNQEAALKWVQFLVSEDTQKAMAQVGQIPVLNSLVGNADLPAHFQVFMEQLKTAQARTPTPKWSDIDNSLNNAFQYMLRGEKTARQALDDAAVEIDTLLAGGTPQS
jgi:multiple sugar transport system substrate-binding protein